MPPKKVKEGAVEKTKRAPKAKKDPNAPKGASGAYIWFCQEKRAGVKAKHPAWGIGEIGKELGTEWKALDDKQKEPYAKQAAKDKERWLKESAAYKKTLGAPAPKAQKEKASKPNKEAKAAKKPPAKIASEEDDDDDDGDDDEEEEEDDE